MSGLILLGRLKIDAMSGKMLFLLCFSFMMIAPVFSQREVSLLYDSDSIEIQQIEASSLDEYRKDDAFNYEIIQGKPTWWNDFKSWLGNLFLRFFEWLFGVEKAKGFLAIFFRIIPYILLGVLIYLLTKFFLKVSTSPLMNRTANDTSVHLSEEEYLIKNEDLQPLIQKALKDKNYRLAIRFYYLYLLQVMTEKGLIQWEIQKTNYDYLLELEKTALQQPFGHITNLYDHIWYGDFPINEQRYLNAEKSFTDFKAVINGRS
ncbi:DUF4129 domain-containing protein [Pareuzebyella sediminis]|uniref:DUF4129 domain-containing protein n=1 Tax=Pareuzebyella sediminis TaxID=2607998 RepID=UPI0011F0357C|nr:DUF4129 domain-containing protein [Pareuzebyella sediminis]